jgi:hypothetical protein
MKKIYIIALLLGIVQGAWADTTGSWVNSDYRDNSWGSDYSSSDAFTVSTAAQLAQLAYMVAYEDKFFQNKTITLSADIDLSAHFWLPIGTVQASSFKGSFDGARHTIKGIYINETRAYSGLFGYIDGGAWIKNIKITDSNINADSQYTGAIVGYSTNCKIENCSVASSVEVTSTRVPSSGQDAATGGLVGRLSSGSAELWGCVSAAFVNGKEKVGGLVGEVVSSHVVSCLYTGSSVQAPESITTQAALFGNINGGDYLHYNLYTNSALDGKNGQDKRGYAITPPSGVTLNFGSPVNSYDVSGISYYTFSTGSTNYSLIAYEGLMYCASDQRITFTVSAPLGYVVSFSVTASAGNLSESGGTYELFTTNSDCIISATAELTEWVGEGTGTEAKPYLVKTCDDLRWIACYTNAENSNHYAGKYFKLANNIVFDGTENNYTTIGNAVSRPFSGTLDGQGYTINGINISADGIQGLFGAVRNGTIKNVKLSNSTFTSTNNASVGGIVANVSQYPLNDFPTQLVTIENCHVANDVVLQAGNNVGGILGNGNTNTGEVTIKGCTSGASLVTTGTYGSAGGIIGSCGFDQTYATGDLYVTIQDCLYYGNSVSGNRKGGIIGTLSAGSPYSKTDFSNNFYCYPLNSGELKGVGYKFIEYNNEPTNFDITATYGAVRARVVSESQDIADMGTEGTQLYIGGITPYTYGIKYADKYYSHVLALEDAADNTDVIAQYAGQIYNVKLRGRTLYKDGNWNTITLPFTLDRTGSIFTDPSQCTVMELDIENEYKIKDDNSDNKYKTGCKDGKLYLFFYGGDQTITTLEAGKPYIVKWEKVNDYNANAPETYDHLYPMFENVEIDNSDPVTITSQDGTVSFVPTYAPFNRDYADRSVLFLGAANMLYYPSGAGNVSVNSFRAYFQLNGVQMVDDSGDEPVGPGNVKVFVFDIEEGDASGIGIVRSKTEDGRCDVWYSLDGKRLNGTPAQKGIYIHNGRKEVLK